MYIMALINLFKLIYITEIIERHIIHIITQLFTVN